MRKRLILAALFLAAFAGGLYYFTRPPCGKYAEMIDGHCYHATVKCFTHDSHADPGDLPSYRTNEDCPTDKEQPHDHR